MAATGTNSELKEQVEGMYSVRGSYDQVHAKNPSKARGVTMKHIRVHVPVHGGTGGNIYQFKDNYTKKNLDSY